MLHIDNRGRIKAPGRGRISRVWDADLGVPAVAAPAAGSKFSIGRGEAIDTGVQAVIPGSGIPRIMITGQAAPDSTTPGRRRAALVGEAFDASLYTAVRLRAVFSGGGVNNNIPPRIGFPSSTGASTSGATIIQQTTGTFARLFTNGIGGSTNREIPWRWNEPPARHDLTVWWTPADGQVMVCVEDDVPVYEQSWGTVLQGGMVYPIVGIQAQSVGLQAIIDVFRMEVDLFYE